MRRIILTIVVITIIASLLFWLVPWLQHGGWPSSGPTGDTLPPHIQYVKPGDGEVIVSSFGFCVHFDYQNGNTVDKERGANLAYFFDGWNVSRQVYDITSLEYPTQVEEPCYTRAEALPKGWHTVKVTYKDIYGERYEYKWRFQVTTEE